jgi:hypothetical protein
MAHAEEANPLLAAIHEHAASHDSAERTGREIRDQLMVAIHHARCARVPWAQIIYTEARARGLTPGHARRYQTRMRKALHRFRKTRGLPACDTRGRATKRSRASTARRRSPRS